MRPFNTQSPLNSEPATLADWAGSLSLLGGAFCAVTFGWRHLNVFGPALAPVVFLGSIVAFGALFFGLFLLALIALMWLGVVKVPAADDDDVPPSRPAPKPADYALWDRELDS